MIRNQIIIDRLISENRTSSLIKNVFRLLLMPRTRLINNIVINDSISGVSSAVALLGFT